MKTTEVISAVELGKMIVIDLRDAVEMHSSGWASGALHIPLIELSQKADPTSPSFDTRLATGKPIALYSAAGARSAKGQRILADLGYKVVNLGGFYDWAVAGGAITR